MDTRQNHTTNHPQPPLENERNLDSHVKTVAPSSTSYPEGYIHGRASERSLENQHKEVRSEKIAARGLLLGIALTSLVGLTIGALFLLNQRDETVPQTPLVVPSPHASQTPARETTVIERTTETTQDLAPTTQEPPAVSQDVQPDIRITIPSPRQQQAPAQPNTRAETAPAPSQNQTAPTNSSAVEQNATPQTSPAPLQNQIINGTGSTAQPNTNGSASSARPQNQTSPGTSTRIQPDTTNSTLPGQTQNQSDTNTPPTNQTNTTDSDLPEQTQNETQPANSDSVE